MRARMKMLHHMPLKQGQPRLLRMRSLVSRPPPRRRNGIIDKVE